MEASNIEVKQISMIKLDNGETVVGLTLNLYTEDKVLKTNNYKISLRLSSDDLVLKIFNSISEKLLNRIANKINI